MVTPDKRTKLQENIFPKLAYHLLDAIWLTTACFLLLVATGCKNTRKQSDKDGIISTITPEMKKALSEYDVKFVGKNIIIVVTRTSGENATCRMGGVDAKGELIIPIEYESLFPIQNGLLVARKPNSKYGLIDLNGKEVVPFKYDILELNGDYLVAQENNRFGILNLQGKEVVPLEYDHILKFYQEYGSVGILPYKYEGAFYLDKGGDVKVVNLDRSGDSHYGEHQDTPTDYQRAEQNGKYGFLNYVGQEIPCKYQDARKYFSEDYAAVVLDNKVGFIDMQGNVKIPFQYEYSKAKFHNGWPTYSRKSRRAFETEDYYYYGLFSEGYACMIKDGKYGYIDKSGKMVIPFEYSWASPFHHGTAVVEKKSGNVEKYGLIDKNNSLIMPIEFELIWYYPYAQTYKVKKNGKIGIYSDEGKCLVPCQYDNDPLFSYNYEGYARVQKNGRIGLIDRNGREVIPCQYDFCRHEIAFGECVEVGQNGKQGVVDLNNQIIVPIEFESVSRAYNNKNLFIVKKDGKTGLYDRCGNCTLD